VAFRIGEAFVEVRADLGQARRDVDQLSGDDVTLRTRLDTTQARTDLAGISDEQITARARVDTTQARTDLSGIQDEEVEVRARVLPARDASGKFTGSGDFRAAGEEAGDDMAAGIGERILGNEWVSLAVGVAGAFVVPFLDALNDGLDREVTRDLFQAQTGLSPAAVATFGRAAGEAYASNFGDSMEGNLEAARAALAAGILGGDATEGEIARRVSQLSTVSAILGEEIPAVARGAGQALRTGLVRDADEAFGLMVRAGQRGVTVSEDLVDTLNEYGTQFRKLGLDGPTALGLISQGLQGGARDADLVADALKELSIRAVDGSESSTAAYEALGLAADGTTARFAAGGESARAALGDVLTALHAMEDPVARNAAGVGLFGTQWEDLGAAVDGLDVAGAAAEMGDLGAVIDDVTRITGDNVRGSMDSAWRGLKQTIAETADAVAAELAPSLQGLATWATTHRADLVGVLGDAAGMALAFTAGIVEGAPMVIRGWDDLSSSIVRGALAIGDASAVAQTSFLTLTGRGDEAAQVRDDWVATSGAIRAGLEAQHATAEATATFLEGPGARALENTRRRVDDAFDAAESSAAFTDAMSSAMGAVNAVGLSADGTRKQLDDTADAMDYASRIGSGFHDELVAVRDAMEDQADAGRDAGRSAADLAAAHDQAYTALLGTLTAMGLSEEQARDLAAQYGVVPADVSTTIHLDGSDVVERRLAAVDRGLDGIDGRTVTALLQVRERYLSAKDRQNFATGGLVYGGSGVLDDVPAMLTAGEFVISRDRVADIGVSRLEALNAGVPLPAPTGPGSGTGAAGGPVTVHVHVDMDQLAAMGSVHDLLEHLQTWGPAGRAA
jgi:hypothetical protein